MPSSYSPTAATLRDRAREQLGDTAVQPFTTLILDDDALHADVHYDAVLARLGETLGIAYLAHELWARFAQEPQRLSSQGDLIDLSAQLEVWSTLAQPWLAHQAKLAGQAAAALSPARTARIGIITAGSTNELR